MADFRSFAADRVMIMAAPNGARRNKADHAALPITAAELAADAVELRDCGVSVLHLHVRDAAGRHTLDADRYREAIVSIRDHVGDDLIIQVTTEAVGMYSAAEQMTVVRDLKPEAVSLALRELCPEPGSEQVAADFFAWLNRERIWPQYILYSPADLERFEDMRRRGVFSEDAPFAMFVLGNYTNGIAGSLADLDAILSAVDCDAFPWAVCCFGGNEHDVMIGAAARGGHVRMGFENNVLMADGSAAPDNAALIRQFTTATAGGARLPGTVAEIRSAFLPAPQQLL
jgi:uncharacterized protein (DUF849 family)